MYTFWKSCPDITPDELDAHRAMINNARDINRTSFRKAIGKEALDEWATARGYDKPGSRQGLTLARDWHVSYAVSDWDGEKCYFITWSAFEFIWRAGVQDSQDAA